MKMERKKVKLFKTGAIGFGFFMLCFLISCEKKTNISSLDIINRSIDFHGGSSKWNKIKQLSFDKKTILYYKDQSIESEVDQFQLFQFKDNSFGKLEWDTSDGDEIQILFDKGKISKRINDSLVNTTEALKTAENSFWASQYVISQPFNLTDKNITLSSPINKLFEDKQAYAISISYQEDVEMSDKWTYYFDVNTYAMLGCKVVRPDHTSLIENIGFNDVNQFKFYNYRKSYRLDESENKTYLRAEYWYSNFLVHY